MFLGSQDNPSRLPNEAIFNDVMRYLLHVRRKHKTARNTVLCEAFVMKVRSLGEIEVKVNLSDHLSDSTLRHSL